jgi:hypothetical protein
MILRNVRELLPDYMTLYYDLFRKKRFVYVVPARIVTFPFT